MLFAALLWLQFCSCALTLVAAVPKQDAALMTLQLFADHGEPNALCMDGSSSGIYFAPATTQPDHYVLYLEGGGWCNDEKSCESRCGSRPNGTSCSQPLASSTVWGKTQSMVGLFSTSANKTTLPGANKAYLRYCTGDAHMGDRDASADSFNFNFHGSRTVKAAISLLVKEYGLGSKPGHTLLFGGGSAGGRGVMANLDFIPGLLSAMPQVSSPPRVLGFPDSPYWIDLVPDRASGVDTFIGFAQQTQEIFALANISGRASAECAATYASAPWKCALGVYRMPFVTTPYMMVASQADAFQMGEDIGHIPRNAQELAYWQVFADCTHGNASRLVAPGTAAAAAGSTVFSMNCYSHSTSMSDYGMSGMNVHGWRMMDALAAFMGLPGTSTHHPAGPLPAGGLFDPAVGFSSGKGCLKPTPGPRPKGHCGGYCAAHGYKPDICDCNVCGSFGGCSFSCTADNRTRFECPTPRHATAARVDHELP